MEFLVLARRRTEAFTEEEFATLLDDEAEAMRALYAEGAVRSAWSRSDVLGAAFLLEADTHDHAQSLIARLPLAQRNMLEMQIVPLKGYRGFGPRT